jgi:hypothetical protein
MNINDLKIGNKLEVSRDFTVHAETHITSLCDDSNTCTIIHVDSDYVLALYYNEKHILLRYKLDKKCEVI